MTTVKERVIATVADNLKVEVSEVTDDAHFEDNLNADSLDLVELVMALEDEFSTDGQRMEIPDDEAAKIRTVKAVMVYLESRGIKDE